MLFYRHKTVSFFIISTLDKWIGDGIVSPRTKHSYPIAFKTDFKRTHGKNRRIDNYLYILPNHRSITSSLTTL